MPNRSPSKQRLEELIALARTYRGWSTKDLSRELGRDAHHLVPESGVPKLDIVVALAEALDWTVQDVVDDLYDNVPSGASEKPKETWAELDRAAFNAFNEGRLEESLALAAREVVAASNGDERARAFSRQFAAWESLGSYLRAADVAQRGLAEPEAHPETLVNLRNGLALAHHHLGRYTEAEGVASCTLQMIADGVLTSRFITAATGFAHYVRASSRCAIAAGGDSCSRYIGTCALADVNRAIELYDSVVRDSDVPGHLGILHMCRGLRLEIESLLGGLNPRDALALITDELDRVVDPSTLPRDSRLEALGWWCVYGTNIAVRSDLDDDERGRLMGVFTNKADEIAERLGNWALRERVWAMELARRSTAGGDTATEWLVDRDDVRHISGAMARFPAFRPVGWKVLRSVQIRDIERDSS